MKSSQVNFTSRINILSNSGFTRVLEEFAGEKFVGAPYTVNEITRAQKACTRDVMDCTAGGLIVKNKKNNGFDIVMFHIDPKTEEDFDFKVIVEKINKELSGDRPLQGFILGSKWVLRKSKEMFLNFEEMMKNFDIPYTKVKGTNMNGDYIDFAYNGEKDELSLFVSTLTNFKNNGCKYKIPEILEEASFAPQDTVVNSNPFLSLEP